MSAPGKSSSGVLWSPLEYMRTVMDDIMCLAKGRLSLVAQLSGTIEDCGSGTRIAADKTDRRRQSQLGVEPGGLQPGQTPLIALALHRPRHPSELETCLAGRFGRRVTLAAEVFLGELQVLFELSLEVAIAALAAHSAPEP